MKDIVIAAGLAVALLLQQTSAQQTSAQQTGQQKSTPAQTAPLPSAPSAQSIPDAPKPQLPGIGTVTPGAGTTSTSDTGARSTVADPDDPDQPAVGSTLPQSKTPALQDEEQGSDPAVVPGQQVYTLPTIGVNSVEIPFTVKDNKGRLVPGLIWRDVRVYENNVRQKMQVFTVDPFPLSVAVVIDQSMTYDVQNRVNTALGALQDAFTPYDEVSVVTYNNGPKLQTAPTAGQSARLSAVIERSKASGRDPLFYDTSGPMAKGISLNGGANDALTPLSAGGPASPQGVSNQQVPRENHTLNDAILMAAESVSKADRGRRRVIYVISDGKEYGSTAKTKQVIKYLQTNKIELCATLVGDSSVSGLGFVESIHLPMMMRDNILPVYTKATGGEFYADYRTKAIETSFAKITEDARTQYTVWYNTREPFIDGKYRKVEVRILKPNLQVIAKDGYYPSAQDTRPRPTPIANSVAPTNP